MPKAATARKARTQEPTPPTPPEQEPAPANADEGHAEPGPATEPTFRLAPAIGDVVYFIDRERYVRLVESRKRVEPLPAMVSLIHRNGADEFEGNLGLVVFDPDSGAVARHRVPYSPDLEPEHWTPRPLAASAFTLPAVDLVNALKPLVEAAVEERIEAIAGTPDEAETVDV